MRSSCLPILTVLLISLPSCAAFLFGRTSVIAPPLLSPARSLAIVDTELWQAVSFAPGVGSSSLIPPTLTLTSGFANNSAYVTVTRAVVVPFSSQDMYSNDIFYDDETETVWALFEENTLVSISVANATVLSVQPLPPAADEDVSEWFLAQHEGGQRYGILRTMTAVWWTLPNGTITSVAFNSGKIVYYSAWYILVDEIYVVFVDNYHQNLSVLVINVTDASTRTMPAPLETEVYKFNMCAFLFNATTVAFGASGGTDFNTLILVLVNTQTLALSELSVGTSDLITSGWRCAPTAAPGQVLAWFKEDWELTFFVLNVSSPESVTFAQIKLPASIGYWIGATMSPNGDLLASSCDSTQDDALCELHWFMHFSPPKIAPEDKVQGLSVLESRFESAQMLSPSTAMMHIKGDWERGPFCAFLLVDLATEIPRVAATIGADMPFLSSYFSVEPGTLRILASDELILGVPFVYAINWLAAPSLDRVAISTTALPFGEDAQGTDLVIFAENGKATLGGITDWLGTSELCEYDYSAGVFTLLQNVSLPIRITRMLATPNDTLAVMAMEGVLLLDSTHRVQLRWWPFSDERLYVESWAATLSPDNSTLYTFLWTSNDVITCSYVSLSAPNGTKVTMVETPIPPNGTLAVIGLAVFNSDFLYLGFLQNEIQIFKFTPSCVQVGHFSSVVPAGTFESAVMYYEDQLILGYAPVLVPVFLDCGSGFFRNVSSSLCTACPNGSVSAVADTQACLPCPARSAPDCLRVECLCSAGFFSPENNADCNVCPQGGVCGGANSLLPAPGYWRVNDSTWSFYSCPYAAGCNGSDHCASGYGGVLCAVCEDHHALMAGSCVRCSSLGMTALFWLLAALLYIAAFILIMYSGPSSISVLKSFISFAQIVTFPTSGPVPHLLRSKFVFVTRFFSLANFQLISLLSPDCLLDTHVSFPEEAVAAALLPIIVILGMLLFIAVPWHQVRARCFSRTRSLATSLASADLFNEAPPPLSDRIEAYKRSGTPLRVMLFILLLATPSTTQQLASFFTCTNVAGVAYLVRDFTVECYRHLWVAFATPVALLLALYALAVPFGLLYLLARYRQRLDLGFLHLSYKDEYYWWDFTEQIRKLTLLLCNAVLAPRAPSYYAPTSLAISVVALSAHLSSQPYRKPRDQWFQTADLAGVTLYFFWAITPPQESAADTLAWLYWIYAIAYTLASIGVLVQPLVVRCVGCIQCCKRDGAGEGADSELDSLIPRTKTSK